MKNTINAVILSALCSGAMANTWVVSNMGKADFNNIQEAVDAASDGDVIVVMPGTYTSTQDGHTVNTLGKAVTIRSSDPSDSNVVATTIIDGENTRRGIACYDDETSETIIDGITFLNGYASEFDYNGNGWINVGERNGGAIFCYQSSPTVFRCVFQNNAATDGTSSSGGGIYCYYGDMVVEDCSFTGNHGHSGGAVHFAHSNSTVTNCVFENNDVVYHAGAAWCSYETTSSFIDCVFTNNLSLEDGGAMYNKESFVQLTNCVFSDNVAEDGDFNNDGGGIYNDYSSAIIVDCSFTNNVVNGDGGALYNFNSEDTTISNTLFCGNTETQIVGEYIDNGGNTIDERCQDPCAADIDGDDLVSVDDLLAIIDMWGNIDSPGDISGDGVVEVNDLLMVVGSWGPCNQ